MAIQFASGALKSRDTPQSQWEDAIVAVRVNDVAVQDTTPTGTEHIWVDTDDPGEVVVPTIEDHNVLANAIGIVVDGNKSDLGATAGQYVILQNSTITGKDDGLYTAAKAIPADTVIDGTYLTAVSGGGLNDLQNGQITLFGSGLVMTGDQNFAAYGNYTVTLFPNHTMKADIACKVESSIGAAGYYGGVDKTIFDTLTGKTITPVRGGTVLFFDENRALMSENGYGGLWDNGTVVNHPDLWIPSRIYETAGTVGTWALNHWQVGKFFYGTVIGTWA